jgi:hypothetical protein
MRKALYLAAAAGLSVITLAADVRPSEALTVYQWCAHYGGRNSAHNCGFTTWAQCMAAISGNGGHCAENPWWGSPQAERRTRRLVQ